ncbi:MAG: hypothetical protein M1831_004923 [Alyxoria varia]|nr:MAG: hypothetical protein M1831_004923 [Alyxoria varia]
MPHAPVSILMTRIPGEQLSQVYETLTEKEKENALQEMKEILRAMRGVRLLGRKENQIYSFLGTPIRSVRVPLHKIGPCESEQELNEYLISFASSHSFHSDEAFHETLVKAKRIQSMPHRIVFTHGDLKHHNILFHDGHISALLDWESAGFYPDYWEFTTALRMTTRDFWWFDFASALGGSEYEAELECDKALNWLTVDSYAW